MTSKGAIAATVTAVVVDMLNDCVDGVLANPAAKDVVGQRALEYLCTSYDARLAAVGEVSSEKEDGSR